jgi:hypothetical protein
LLALQIESYAGRLKGGAEPMSDTTYAIFQDGQTYKVRIKRLGEFAQERIAVIEEQKEPMTSAHLRVV